jgi:uncharacterized protein (DUF1778 family)
MKKETRLGIRVSEEDKHVWQAAAQAAGLSLSAWLTRIANQNSR